MATASFACLFGLMESKQSSTPWGVRLSLPFFVGLPCLFFLYWLWRERIVADADGLRWRQTGKEKITIWEQVEDYFITLSRHGSSVSRLFVVKFADGRTLKFDRNFGEFSRLQKIISDRAVNAKAKGWLIRSKEGTLSGKIVGTYSEKKHRARLWLYSLTLLLFLGMGIGVFFTSEDSSKAGVIVTTLLFWPITIGGFGWIVAIAVQKERQHLGERLEADEAGFTFFRADGDGARVGWGDVDFIRSGSSGGILSHYSFLTDSGSYTILETMENSGAIRAMAHQYAPQAIIVTQSAPARDALAPTEKTDGKRTFHYRTRSNRSLLATGLISTLLIPAVGGYVRWMELTKRIDVEALGDAYPNSPVNGLFVFWGVLFAGWAYGLWRYKSAQLVLDGEGITSYGLRGVKRIGYEEIARLGAGETFFVETHDGRRPVKWFPSIADVHELRLELEKRTGLRFLSAEGVEQAENPAEQPDQIQQKLERGHAGR